MICLKEKVSIFSIGTLDDIIPNNSSYATPAMSLPCIHRDSKTAGNIQGLELGSARPRSCYFSRTAYWMKSRHSQHRGLLLVLRLSTFETDTSRTVICVYDTPIGCQADDHSFAELSYENLLKPVYSVQQPYDLIITMYDSFRYSSSLCQAVDG